MEEAVGTTIGGTRLAAARYFRIYGRFEQPHNARCFERAGGCVQQLELVETFTRGYNVQVLVWRLGFRVHDPCRRAPPGHKALKGTE
jgi:hypothetical protein